MRGDRDTTIYLGAQALTQVGVALWGRAAGFLDLRWRWAGPQVPEEAAFRAGGYQVALGISTPELELRRGGVAAQTVWSLLCLWSPFLGPVLQGD